MKFSYRIIFVVKYSPNLKVYFIFIGGLFFKNTLLIQIIFYQETYKILLAPFFMLFTMTLVRLDHSLS